jgi:ABC-type polysaccharide/polyol phosphate transport system ATPase subunit
MPAALIVDSVGKCFKVQRKRLTLVESMARVLVRCKTDEVVWALTDVSFSLEEGKVLGIIGHNGAGKSTLLRLLCKLGQPTRGRIEHSGYMSGLLDLGSGLSQDLTGRENILTVGILNGLTRKQIRAQEEEIIGFAELEDFIDQPVRTYSSGMYMRLAFSAAIHFDPDVLIVDEVLAVGDARFHEKCIDRLHAFRKAGKTLVLVSHNTDQIRSLCDEVLVLEEGRVVAHDEPKRAVECYNDVMRRRSETRAAELSGGRLPDLSVRTGRRFGTQEAKISSVQILDEQGKSTDKVLTGDSVTVALEYNVAKPLSAMTVILGIYNEANVKCLETVVPSISTSRTNNGRLHCHLPKLPLLPGRYYVDIGLYPIDWNYIYDYHWHMHVLRVESPNGVTPGVSGVISVNPVWSVYSQA